MRCIPVFEWNPICFCSQCEYVVRRYLICSVIQTQSILRTASWVITSALKNDNQNMEIESYRGIDLRRII